MQFLQGGRLFDTATSVKAAVARGVRSDAAGLPGVAVRFEKTLYRTEQGAFWLHVHMTTKLGRGRPVVEDSARVFTAEDALTWITKQGAVLIDGTGLTLPQAG